MNRYIVLPDRSGRRLFNTTWYDLYVTLEKIAITNQKLYDAEIEEIKKNTLIINSHSNDTGRSSYTLLVNYLFKTSNKSFNCGGSNAPQYNFFLENNIDNWKQVVLNHKKIEALKNIILENEIELQNQRDTIEGLTPGAGPLNPQEQMSLINEIDELKKLISQKKIYWTTGTLHLPCINRRNGRTSDSNGWTHI